ncbi:MAG: antitoxin [Actinomycetota bacterium]|nr:antitoxin [Actinomycetota bacterium]
MVEQARLLQINVSAAARAGVAAAVRAARAQADPDAYQEMPGRRDQFWNEAEAWGPAEDWSDWADATG